MVSSGFPALTNSRGESAKWRRRRQSWGGFPSGKAANTGGMVHNVGKFMNCMVYIPRVRPLDI